MVGHPEIVLLIVSQTGAARTCFTASTQECHKRDLPDRQWKILDPLVLPIVNVRPRPGRTGGDVHLAPKPGSSQRSMHSPRPSPSYRGGNQTASATSGVHSHDRAIIHSCSSPTASGSFLGSTLARAVSRRRPSRPPDRRRGRSLA